MSVTISLNIDGDDEFHIEFSQGRLNLNHANHRTAAKASSAGGDYRRSASLREEMEAMFDTDVWTKGMMAGLT